MERMEKSKKTMINDQQSHERVPGSHNIVGYIWWPSVFYLGNFTLKDEGGKVLLDDPHLKQSIINIGLFPDCTEKVLWKHATYQ